MLAVILFMLGFLVFSWFGFLNLMRQHNVDVTGRVLVESTDVFVDEMGRKTYIFTYLTLTKYGFLGVKAIDYACKADCKVLVKLSETQIEELENEYSTLYNRSCHCSDIQGCIYCSSPPIRDSIFIHVQGKLENRKFGAQNYTFLYDGTINSYKVNILCFILFNIPWEKWCW